MHFTTPRNTLRTNQPPSQRTLHQQIQLLTSNHLIIRPQGRIRVQLPQATLPQHTKRSREYPSLSSIASLFCTPFGKNIEKNPYFDFLAFPFLLSCNYKFKLVQIESILWTENQHKNESGEQTHACWRTWTSAKGFTDSSSSSSPSAGTKSSTTLWRS